MPKFEIGDKVIVSGRIYQSANGTLSNKMIEKHIGIITKIAETAAHPYGVFGITGWFNEDAITEYIAPPVKQGDKAKVIKPLTYSNKPFIARYNSYDVLKIDGDKAFLGINGKPSVTVNIYNLQKIK